MMYKEDPPKQQLEHREEEKYDLDTLLLNIKELIINEKFVEATYLWEENNNFQTVRLERYHYDFFFSLLLEEEKVLCELIILDILCKILINIDDVMSNEDIDDFIYVYFSHKVDDPTNNIIVMEKALDVIIQFRRIMFFEINDLMLDYLELLAEEIPTKILDLITLYLNDCSARPCEARIFYHIAEILIEIDPIFLIRPFMLLLSQRHISDESRDELIFMDIYTLANKNDEAFTSVIQYIDYIDVDYVCCLNIKAFIDLIEKALLFSEATQRHALNLIQQILSKNIMDTEMIEFFDIYLQLAKEANTSNKIMSLHICLTLLERYPSTFINQINIITPLLADIDDEFMHIRYLYFIEINKNVLDVDDFRDYVLQILERYDNEYISEIASNYYDIS